MALQKKIILAVETSCDDTSVAIVREDGFVIAQKIAHQQEIHQAYGGVVPELASRNHAYHLLPMIDQILEEAQISHQDIDGLAVTNRPGLVGSLMVGLITVKTLCLLWKKHYVAVNHVEGHLMSGFLWDSECPKKEDIQFPFLALIASGAHTHLFVAQSEGCYGVIGYTVDDAAGEAMDKFARALNLGYPGGAQIDQLSQKANLGNTSFPKVNLKKNPLNFSFSGLKVAGLRAIEKIKNQKNSTSIGDLCADYQEAVMDHIMSRLDRAFQQFYFPTVVLAGGVSANTCLRNKARIWAKKNRIQLVLPHKKYCTDNASMIGRAGFYRFLKKQYSSQTLNCYPYSLPEDFIRNFK